MSVTTVIGPMGAGKTTELLRLVRRYQLAQKSIIAVKYSKDNRYDLQEILTHDKHKLESITVIPTSDLQSIYETLLNYQVVAIDEAQFIDNIPLVVSNLASNGVTVILTCLISYFNREPTRHLAELVVLSDKLVHLTSICTVCGESAQYTRKLGDHSVQEVIGGFELYQPVCRKHYT